MRTTEGASFIQGASGAYFRFTHNSLTVGRAGEGAFVTTKSFLDSVHGKAKSKSNSDTKGYEEYEEALGWGKGDLTGRNNGFVRFDIKNPRKYNLRLPTGRESGVWDGFWVPGGYTSGGAPECLVDVMDLGSRDLSLKPKFLGENLSRKEEVKQNKILKEKSYKLSPKLK